MPTPPTPTAEPKLQSPDTLKPDLVLVLRRSLELLGGALFFTVLFILHSAIAVVRRHDTPFWAGVGIAATRTCNLLGATFIKIGQIASTRGDLIPPAVTRELRSLQDNVPAFDSQIARQLIESELGKPIDEIYAEFEDTPIAAASVAQVHRARMADGQWVAVKIRRPDIARKVSLDRSILLAVAHGLERVIPSLRLISVPEAVATFCDAVEVQLSLEREADNNRRFQAMFVDDPDIRFPMVRPEASSDGVLTMEFMEGVHERDLESAGIDVERVVHAGMRAVSHMIFDHGFVHADLHPGNMLFSPPGQLTMIDLGLVGDISDEDRVTTVRLFFSLATGDGATCARLFFENAPHTATPDYDAYEREVTALVSDVMNQGLANLQITYEIGRIFDILRRHRVQARAHMTMVNLALMTAEGLGKRLAPDFNLTQEAVPYLQSALTAAMQAGKIPPSPPRD